MKISANLAMSLDGRIDAAVNSQRIGSPLDLQKMKAKRRLFDAILVGGATFRRWPIPYGATKPILNAVLTRVGVGASLPPDLSRWHHEDVTLMVMTSTDGAQRPLMQRNDIDLRSTNVPSVSWALSQLEDLGVENLLCEGGGKMLEKLIDLKRLNQLHVTICPKLLGRGRLLLEDFIPDVELRLASHEAIGSEIFTTYDCVYRPVA